MHYAPIDASYTLNNNNNKIDFKNIPIKTSLSKTLYENTRTYKLIKSNKVSFDINKVSGFASLAKFNPQDLGLPK